MTFREHELEILLQRYQEGKASPEERLFLEQWYEQLDVSGGQVWASQEPEQATKEKLYAVIVNRLQDATPAGTVAVLPQKRRPYSIISKVLRAAAVVLLAIPLVWLARLSWRKQPAAVTTISPARQGTNNAPDKPSATTVRTLIARSGNTGYTKVQLADGSMAWLNAGSVLKYPDHFTGTNRIVQVEQGEVFFNVVRDSSHPFRVYTGSVTTTVLGTSFVVKQSYEKNTVEVSVKTGVVKVERTDHYGAALVGRNLLPGDQLRFDTTANTYQLKKMAVNGIAAFLQGKLVYEDARLEEIVYDISRKYGVSIHFDNNRLKDCRYRISFDDMPLPDCLQILSTLTNTHVEKQDKGRYTITGDACN